MKRFVMGGLAAVMIATGMNLYGQDTQLDDLLLITQQQIDNKSGHMSFEKQIAEVRANELRAIQLFQAGSTVEAHRLFDENDMVLSHLHGKQREFRGKVGPAGAELATPIGQAKRDILENRKRVVVAANSIHRQSDLVATPVVQVRDPSDPDPASPSLKMRQTLSQIRGVEDLNRLKRDNQSLREGLQTMQAKLADLGNVPTISLQGTISDAGSILALIDWDGKTRIVRQGELISVTPKQRNKGVVRTVRVKEISVNSVLMEMQQTGQMFVLK